MTPAAGASGATVRIVNPAAEDGRPELTLAPRLATLEGATIALIDNTKHMAAVFLEEIRRVLQEKHKVREFHYYRKPHASVPIPAEVMTRLVTTCDAVVHGVAD